MSNAFLSTGLWGNLLRDEVVAQAFSAPAFLARMLDFERAWTQSLTAHGEVSPEQSAAALRAIDSHAPDFVTLASGSNRDGLPVPALVASLRQGLSEQEAKAIHTGATSQDVIDTAMMCVFRDLLHDFEGRLDAVLESLAQVMRAYGHAPLMGRTRMQAALPIDVAHRVSQWRTGVAAQRAALPELRTKALHVQIGGPVGQRRGVLDDDFVAMMAECLDLAPAPVWHSARANVVEIGHWLVLVTGALGKMGHDMALMAQQGIDEISFDGAGGSSAMPHKQNPVQAEALVSLARSTANGYGLLAQALVHEQERSGTAWALEWLSLPQMFEATGASLNLAQDLLTRLRHIGTRAQT
ncbi:3-carboxy-cis,cis-muconate cycloisomerase [Roseobacteraceae bacterium S113]